MSAPVTAPEAPRAAKRKPPAAGRGRKKGELNHTTRDVRLFIAKVAERNVHKLDAWLTRVGQKDPGRAMDLYLRMIEYHIPKLSRLETVPLDKPNGRVIDSSQLTAEQREQLRQMILAQPEPVPRGTLLEAPPMNALEPGGLGDAQVVDIKEDRTIVSE